MRDDGLDPARVTLHRKGTGPALVLLHCLGVDHRLWDIAAAGFERDFTLISYDFAGHGATPPAGRSYGVEDLSVQLAALFEREGIARAHVAGISLGGLVAQHFAATHPARVDRLMLLDTTPRYTDEMRQMWVVRAQQARTQGVASLLDNLLPVWFTPGFIAQDPPAVRYVRDCFAGDSGEAYALACEALGAADLQPLVPNITAPTLVVCGDQESAAFKDAARWLAASITGARLQFLSPARHASVLEQPQAFLAAAQGFLAA
ncbi:MAG: alpha/beta fold hydrolase [Stellaceae bacterium]